MKNCNNSVGKIFIANMKDKSLMIPHSFTSPFGQWSCLTQEEEVRSKAQEKKNKGVWKYFENTRYFIQDRTPHCGSDSGIDNDDDN